MSAGPLVRENIKELNRETRSVVKVNEEISRKFWAKKGVRKACPLSPTLFALYIADLHRVYEVYEERAIRRSSNRKPQNMDHCMRGKHCPNSRDRNRNTGNTEEAEEPSEEKDLILNEQKSKLLVFKKGRSKKKKDEWKWGKKEIVGVKEFKHLGYHFQRNGRPEPTC